jgi:antagonist of KipI
VRAGQRIEIGRARAGARSYLCVQGGIDVAPVLGSRSTHVRSGLGGYAGRRLAAGDRLPVGPPGAPRPLPRPHADWPPEWSGSGGLRELYDPMPLRITPGPQAKLFSEETWGRLRDTAFVVSEQSDRMGVRLTGERLPAPPGDLATEGVSLGAIQVPPDGRPILLGVDHQTTGGYAKIANVCSADHHRLGQLRPRDVVRFEIVSFAQARTLLKKRLLQLGLALERLGR